MKKLSYDFFLSIVGALVSLVPTILSIIYVEIAKASGSYGSGSGHDLAIFFAFMFTGILLIGFGIMIVLSLLNDLCNKDIKSQKVFKIIISIIDGLTILGTIGILLLFILFPNL